MTDKYNRVYNFSAGPAVLPVEVLETARDEMLNYNNSGMSVMEMSHRSKTYDEIIKTAKERLKPKSLFVTGNYDRMINIQNKLLQSGFYQPIKKEPNIFERKA